MDYITEIELGRDRRYMRGEGNILVRKNRFKKGVVKYFSYLLIILCSLSLLIIAAKEVYLYLMTTTDLDVRHINISGHKVVSEETLRTSLSLLLKKNILSLDLDQWKKRLLKNPWIEEVSIKRNLPSTLLVEVKEREPVAFFLWKGKTYLVGASGTPIGEYQPELFEYDFPFVTGLEEKSIEQMLNKLRGGVELLEKMKKHEPSFLDLISEINVKEKNFIILGLRDAGPFLYLDLENLQNNLDHYLSIKEDIDRQFEKAEYIDLRWKDRVIIKPLTLSR